MYVFLVPWHQITTWDKFGCSAFVFSLMVVGFVSKDNENSVLTPAEIEIKIKDFLFKHLEEAEKKWLIEAYGSNPDFETFTKGDIKGARVSFRLTV